MKKFFLALLAVASVATANAQKNTWLVYGNAGVMTGKTDNGSALITGGTETETNWNVSPGVGYQFNNHLTVGLQGGYNGWKSVTKSTPALNSSLKGTATAREFQAGVFFRYTQPLSPIFFMWTQVNLSYVDGKTTNETVATAGGISTTAKSSDMYNGFDGSIIPAIGVNVYKGLALNFSIGGLGYRTVSYDKAPTTLNSFNVTFGQQFNFGISKNFGCNCKKKRGHAEPGMEHRKMKKMQDDEDDE